MKFVSKRSARSTLVICFLLVAAHAQPGEPIVVSPSVQIRAWDRDVRNTVEGLMLETTRLQTREIIDLLERTRADSGLDPVARDAVLYQYTQRLRQLSAEDIPEAVLDWLAHHSPHAVRPHEESASFMVPVFDVATAALGVANERQYRLSRQALLDANEASFPALLTTYATSEHRPVRAGMEAAVEDMASESVAALVELTRRDPELRHSQLHATALLRLQNSNELAELLREAPPALATFIVRQAGQKLDQEAASIITAGALAHPDPGTRGVARAQASGGGANSPSGQNVQLVHWTEGPGTLGLGYPVPVPQDTPLPFDGFRTYAGLHERHQDLMNSSDSIFGEIIGHTRLDRDIWLYHFGNPESPNAEGLPKAAFLVNGTIHPREWQAPEVVTGFLEFLAEQEDDGHWVSFLRDNMNIMVIPVNNVDGFLHTQRYPSANYLGSDPVNPATSPRDGRMRRKNHFDTDEDLHTVGDHLHGVDLNRNNEPFWPGVPRNFNPLDLTYHGPHLHSEPEIQALQAAAGLGPEDRLRFYADMHSFTRVFFSVYTHNARRNQIQDRLLHMVSRHHRALPGGKLYTDVPEFPGFGLGTTSEYFAYRYQIPSLTWEIEPGQGGGTEYGGFGSNGHDGFILPESEIRRVRENLAESLAAAAYHMAGPPHLRAVHIIDEASGALVSTSEWRSDGSRQRERATRLIHALEPGRAYLFWLAFDKPMRWRHNGEVRVFPGQPAQSLEMQLELYAGNTPLAIEPSTPVWNDTAGPSPHGYLRYRDDSAAVRVQIADTGANRELMRAHPLAIRVGARDMSGHALDDDPATVVDWENGAWTGYADDRGGTDRSHTLPDAAQAAGTGFPIDPGHSALWFDRQRAGEGFIVENLGDQQALMYWFTYDQDGGQRWLIGVGDIHGNRITFPDLHITSGGRFGPDFDPDEVVRDFVARGEFLFTGCNHGWFEFEGFDQHDRFELTRLSHTMGVTCDPPVNAEVSPAAGQSGTWFDPAHSGEGFIMHWMSNGLPIVMWFTYDREGNQYWMLGVGERDGDEIVVPELHATRGARFGDAFDPDDVEQLPWGELRLRLGCDDRGEAVYNSLLPEFGSGSYQLIRLTRLDGLDCPE